MNLITGLIIYFCFSMLYRQRQLQYIFILKSLNTLKISKYRKEISEKVVKYEKRFKWFLFWPLLHIYEIYEDWQANRNRNN